MHNVGRWPFIVFMISLTASVPSRIRHRSAMTRRYEPLTTRLMFGERCFYSASALLAMQSAVLARGIPSVRLSVRPSVTFRYCVQTNEDTIVRFTASGRTIPLVSGEVKYIRIFAGDNPQRGR